VRDVWGNESLWEYDVHFDGTGRQRLAPSAQLRVDGVHLGADLRAQMVSALASRRPARALEGLRPGAVRGVRNGVVGVTGASG
jgi:hypothetical protein